MYIKLLYVLYCMLYCFCDVFSDCVQFYSVIIYMENYINKDSVKKMFQGCCDVPSKIFNLHLHQPISRNPSKLRFICIRLAKFYQDAWLQTVTTEVTSWHARPSSINSVSQKPSNGSIPHKKFCKANCPRYFQVIIFCIFEKF